jgi:phosphatidate cytidylyltransferase
LESKIKRLLRVKDTGSIIPGHGGVIDRLDSFLMATYTLIIFDLFSRQ